MSQSDSNFVQVITTVNFVNSLTYKLPDSQNFNQDMIGKRVTIPFRNQHKIGIIFQQTKTTVNNPKKIKSITGILDEAAFIDTKLLEFYSKIANYYLTPLGEVLFSGVPKWFKSTENKPLPKETWWRVRQKLPDDRIQSIKSLHQRTVFKYIQDNGPIQSKSMSQIATSASTQCNALFKKGLILKTDLAYNQNTNFEDPQFTLTDDQDKALKAISNVEKFQTFLIDGITGSGKTEIYIRLIQKAITKQKQSLVLVPEIGLTPQLFHEISKRINGKVAVLHSGLSDSARAKSWHRAKHGFFDVIVATRSGIFTPFKNLGQIIVDEEHDLSFKQQNGFRYSARDLAVLRGHFENIPVLLGSATPSLETFNNAKNGRYHWLKLRQRTNQKDLPKIQIHDTRNLKLNKGLSPHVIQLIKNEINKGQQVLVFLNRRGWSPKFHCEECSWISECSECDSYLTYHKHMDKLKCHHCERLYLLPEFCPDCGSQKVRNMGVGTEKVESGLLKALPDSDIIRVDRDTVRTPNQWQSKLDQIRTGNPCVMIGTQMLSKGHDFPKLTLVVIVNVDNSFYSLDFRATEHLSQLIIQVSGRAGRNEQSGSVVIQTQSPENPFFNLLLKKSYEDFATHEISQRQKMNFPPSYFMAILRVRSKFENYIDQFFEQLEADLNVPPQVQCFGPLPAPLFKKMGLFNYQLIISSEQRPALHAFLKTVLTAIAKSKIAAKVHWNLDIDPIHLS